MSPLPQNSNTNPLPKPCGKCSFSPQKYKHAPNFPKVAFNYDQGARQMREARQIGPR